VSFLQFIYPSCDLGLVSGSSWDHCVDGRRGLRETKHQAPSLRWWRTGVRRRPTDKCRWQAQSFVWLHRPSPRHQHGERLVGCSLTRTKRRRVVWQAFPPLSIREHEADDDRTAGASVIQLPAVVRDFGVLLDQELGMTQRIARVTSSYVLPAAKTPSDTSSSRPGARRSASSLVCCAEARLWQLSPCLSQPSYRFNASKTQQGGWFSTYGWVITWLQPCGSSIACPLICE